MHRILILLVVLAALASFNVRAQEVEDTIKIKTRVVFLDALVKDKRTNLPISDLTTSNFEVLDNGKARNISYFTREGQARKPLALILILDLRADGAGRFLKRPEILKSMEDELAKLPPGDEVAIMAMDTNEDEERFWLTEFTNDRAKLAAALARVPALSVTHDGPPEDAVQVKKTQDTGVAQAEGKPDDIVETETIRGKNGATITRKTHRDGSVNVTRTNKDGKVTIEMGDVYDMAAAVKDATRKAVEMRPNSQVSVVWVSDGIAPIFFEDRDATEQILIRDNVIFSSLTVEMRTLFKFLVPMAKPITSWMGLSLYGSAKYLAQRSGGEAVKVGRVKDYGAGLSRIIGNLTARYSLGFALAEDEVDDGRMHNLEVRVKAEDQKGKTRKLQVSSRQGYYMSSTVPKEAAAKAQ
jgi:VWFA-related protein